MDTQQVITALNKAIALKHSATLQYQQHALLVNGFWRKIFTDFLTSGAENSLELPTSCGIISFGVPKTGFTPSFIFLLLGVLLNTAP